MSNKEETEKTTSTQQVYYDRFTNHRYITPTPGRLPLIHFCTEEIESDQIGLVYAILKKIGVNCIIDTADNVNFNSKISEAIKNGLSPIISHNSVASLIKAENDEQEIREIKQEFLEFLKSAVGIRGIFTKLNPTYEELSGLVPIIEDVDKNCKMETTSKTKQPPLIIHMLPEQESKPYFQRPDDNDITKSYIAKAQINLGPGIWLTDSDAFRAGRGGYLQKRETSFLNNLEIMSLLSRYTARPFWSKVQNTSSEAMLYTAMQALSYGAQGLIFTDKQVLDSGESKGSVSNPTSGSGINRVIERIKALEGVFLGAIQIDTRHQGATDTSQRNNPQCFYATLENTMGPLLQIEPKAVINDGLTVSHLALMPMKSMLREETFNGEALDFLIITNNDISKKQKFKLTLNPYYKITEVKSAYIDYASDRSKNRLIEEEIVTENGIIEPEINPGDVLVLRWE